MEYKIVTTGDGSPTLSLGPTWEHMHALEGAFTETQYIYQPTVENAFKAIKEPVFLSLGLGLAYNEILIAFEALHQGSIPGLVVSYESEAPLRDQFAAWLREERCDLTPVYNEIEELYAEKYGILAEDAKRLLHRLYENGKLQLLGPVESERIEKSNAILFDPFSSKTTPELWTENFLDRFFQDAPATPCYLSTYACKGELKRALRKSGFTLDIQKGFGKKRHSIFAKRA